MNSTNTRKNDMAKVDPVVLAAAVAAEEKEEADGGRPQVMAGDGSDFALCDNKDDDAFVEAGQQEESHRNNETPIDGNRIASSTQVFAAAKAPWKARRPRRTSSSSSSSVSSSVDVPGAVAIPGSNAHSAHDNEEEGLSSPEAASEHLSSNTWLGVADRDDTATRTMVHAELVDPPIQAVRVKPDHQISSLQSPGAAYEKKRRRHRILLFLGILVVTLGIGLGLGGKLVQNTSGGASLSGLSSFAPSTSPETQASEATGYECYSTTVDLLVAQYDDFIANGQTNDVYVLCGNSTYHIGRPKSLRDNDLDIVDGEFPIIPIAPNTIIQCGENGHPSNDCILDGGFVQVIAQTAISINSQNRPNATKVLLDADLSIDNVTIRGMTFTGTIEDALWITGGSVVVSQRGHITMENCIWRDMISIDTTIIVRRNSYQVMADMPLHTLDTHLTIRNSTFHSLRYDGPLFLVDGQRLTIEGCQFSDSKIVAIQHEDCWYTCTSDDCKSVASNSGWEGSADILGGCAALLACFFGSQCTLSDSCITNFETSAMGLVVAQGPSNLNLMSNDSSNSSMSGYQYGNGDEVWNSTSSNTYWNQPEVSSNCSVALAAREESGICSNECWEPPSSSNFFLPTSQCPFDFQ